MSYFPSAFSCISNLCFTQSMFLMVLIFKGCRSLTISGVNHVFLCIILLPSFWLPFSSEAAHHIALNFTPGVIQDMVVFSVHEKILNKSLFYLFYVFFSSVLFLHNLKYPACACLFIIVCGDCSFQPVVFSKCHHKCDHSSVACVCRCINLVSLNI